MIGPVEPVDIRITTGPVVARIRPDASELQDALDEVAGLVAEARRILDDLPGIGFNVTND